MVGETVEQGPASGPHVPSAWVKSSAGRAFLHPQLAAQGLKQPFWAAPTRRSQQDAELPEHGRANTGISTCGVGL